MAKTGIGKLQLWHHTRYKSYEGVSFDDRTPGDLLAEFYLSVAAEIEQLTANRIDLENSELERLLELEEVLRPAVGDRASLRGLSSEESEEVYGTAHKTGDPLADYWEYRIANDLAVDFDIAKAPPRSEWDRVDDE